MCKAGECRAFRPGVPMDGLVKNAQRSIRERPTFVSPVDFWVFDLGLGFGVWAFYFGSFVD